MTTDTLSRAFDLTRAMQSAADARDWVRVAALVGERSPLLMSLSGEQTPDALDRVRQIMAIDASITAHAQADHHRLTAGICAVAGTHQGRELVPEDGHAVTGRPSGLY
jgi:hypothetical protein